MALTRYQCDTCGGDGIHDDGDPENGPNIGPCDCPAGLLKGLMMETVMDQDEAAHFLVDCGEIDSSTHADLLTPQESERVYG